MSQAIIITTIIRIRISKARMATITPIKAGRVSRVGLSGSLRDRLVVGAREEDSNALGFDGDQDSNSAIESGALYIFQERAC